MPTAVLVDGAFFLHRYATLYANGAAHSPNQVARELHKICLRHSNRESSHHPNFWFNDLYRIFYYDCPPLEKKGHHPLTNRAVDFSKTPAAQFRRRLFEELKTLRKVALRLGHLQGDLVWNIRPAKFKELLSGGATVGNLQENDIVHDVRQKGVDMKIGIDIATLALKKQVDRIVLIAGDVDFVPAAKLARTEGVDFILDPMWNHIAPTLFEHIDGLKSQCPKPGSSVPPPSVPNNSTSQNPQQT